MKNTTNYNLNKPEGTDVVNIDDLNANFEIIDAELFERAKTADIPTKISQLTNDSAYITSIPVTSVNNKTGAVSLVASDVGAVPISRKINNKVLTSDIILSASDVGASVTGHKHTISDITDLSITGVLNWQDVVFQNGYSGNLKYAKDCFGNVWLNGHCSPSIYTTTATVACTLPSGYRPSISKEINGIFHYNNSSMNDVGFIINPDGTIKNDGAINAANYCIDTSFKAEQ